MDLVHDIIMQHPIPIEHSILGLQLPETVYLIECLSRYGVPIELHKDLPSIETNSPYTWISA